MAAYTNEARKANLMLRQALYDHGHVENISGARAVQTQQKACRYSRGSHVHKNALITGQRAANTARANHSERRETFCAARGTSWLWEVLGKDYGHVYT